ELAELAKKYPAVKVLSLEVLKDESIKAAVEQVQKTLKGEGLHLLINHASVFEQENATYATPKRAVVLKHFEVNTVGALMVTSALLPLLRKAAEKNEPARIVNMSPTISSISNNFGTMPWTKGNVAYGMSKAALNHLTRSIAGQEKDSGIVVVSLSPGWVKTSISGGVDAQTPINETAASIVKTVSLLTRADTGRYIDRNGTPINF
ncbi:C-factor-like protein, partial [Aphelenchoides avenae]